ncbi:MAG: alpha/beta hydrolase [Gammaproteobacteria bacterium]
MEIKPSMQRSADLSHGRIEWLEADSTRNNSFPPIVFLHGIGSCADSWRDLMPGLSDGRRVLAWDAPGYGGSAPLRIAQPLAADYAATAAEWLDAAKVVHPVLVGHSLGALIAAAIAARHSSPASGALGLVLVSPAQGYGTADPSVRLGKFENRLQALRSLGAVQLSIERAVNLCSPGASVAAVSRVQDIMSRITEPGYAQAAWMLSNDMISQYLDDVSIPTAVMCGALDAVVTPASAKELAEKYHAPFSLLNDVGHASYIEDRNGFENALNRMINFVTSDRSSRDKTELCT